MSEPVLVELEPSNDSCKIPIDALRYPGKVRIGLRAEDSHGSVIATSCLEWFNVEPGAIDGSEGTSTSGIASLVNRIAALESQTPPDATTATAGQAPIADGQGGWQWGTVIGGGGQPTPVSHASDMTDTSKIYLYTGSESGYNSGHIYYYDGSVWVDGGEYGGGGSEERAYKVAFLGCPDAQTADSTRGFGNCTVIWSADKCVVVDLGNQTDSSKLISFLGSKNITKVDAVIITHYHADHVRASGVQALINSNIDTSTCIWYLPHKNIDWASFTGTTYASEESAVKALLSNPVYPITEGQTVNFGDFTVSFYNVNASLYADYYDYMYDDGMVVTDHTNYNNFSMVCMVSGQGKNVVLTADIEKPAEYNLADVIAQANLLQIPHHGLDTQPNEKAVSAVKAEYSVLSSYGAQKERAFKTAVRPYVSKGMETGTVVSTYNGNDVVFSINLKKVTCAVDNDDVSSGNAIGQMSVSGEDLDDYVTAGQYYVQNASTASNVTNIPVVNGNAIGGGTLTVKGGTNTANGVTQIYIPAFTVKRYICVRTKTTNGWGSWGILDFSALSANEYQRAVANALHDANLVSITATSGAQNGVTFTVNADGSITAVGTATASFRFEICTIALKGGNTYYIGGCPEGGSQSTYRLYFLGADLADVDYGNGASYTPANDESGKLEFYVTNGTALDFTFYPIVLEKSASGGGVTSVNGQTGAVIIGNATSSTAGLMSATDKSNLDTLYADYLSASTALG